jgi:hypothetical protein
MSLKLEKEVQGTEKEKKLAMSLNFSFRYIDDVLSLNNLQFKDYQHQIL